MHAPVLLCVNQHTKFEVPSFTNSKNMNEQHLIKTDHVNVSTPISLYFVIPRLAIGIFYMRTKFGGSRFSRFGDITEGIEIENGPCDLDHAPFRGGLSSVC